MNNQTLELTLLRRENDSLKKELRTDRLTGISNMLAMEEHVALMPQSGVYVFADLDNLGKRNKTDGHHVVDEYIKEFGAWIRDNTREDDSIAIRHHGDEFMVWCSTLQAALAIRNRVRNWRSEDSTVTCSAGIGHDIPTADTECSKFKRLRKQQS